MKVVLQFLGIQDYFQRLTRAPIDQPLRHTIEQAYDLFNKLEKPLVERLFNLSVVEIISHCSRRSIVGKSSTNCKFYFVENLG